MAGFRPRPGAGRIPCPRAWLTLGRSIAAFAQAHRVADRRPCGVELNWQGWSDPVARAFEALPLEPRLALVYLKPIP